MHRSFASKNIDDDGRWRERESERERERERERTHRSADGEIDRQTLAERNTQNER